MALDALAPTTRLIWPSCLDYSKSWRRPDQRDEFVSESMVTHWTNFGKTGNPNRQDKDALALFDRKRLSKRVINSNLATVEGVRKHIWLY